MASDVCVSKTYIGHESRPNKRLKTHVSQVPSSTQPSLMVNGSQPKNACVPVTSALPSKSNTPDNHTLVRVDDQKSLDSTVGTSTRLSKVKSTMELVQAASDCLDSVTRDRILTNRISKEADPPRPSIVPHLTKPRQSRAPGVIHSESVTHQLIPHNSTTTTIPAPPIGARDTPSDDRSTTREIINVTTTTVSRVIETKNDDRRVLSNHIGVTDTDSDTQKTLKPTSGRRKKHKHRHKRHSEEQHVIVPVTNRLDDWPTLPPLPKHIDWHSLDTNHESVITKKERSVDELLSDTWPGVNCTLDDMGHPQPLPRLYSLTLDDQYLHVLPWIDMEGAMRQFFPHNTARSHQEMDRLIDLPEPW